MTTALITMIGLTFSSLLNAGPACAAEKKSSAPSRSVVQDSSVNFEADAQLKLLMHSFYRSFESLRPYLYSFDSFKTEKKKVSLLLSDLEAKVISTEPKAINEAPGFNITYGVIARHLRETVRYYNKGLYDAAWNKLNATPGLCIACHNRLPKPSVSAEFKPSDFEDPNLSNLRLQDAEFYFLSHNFELALKIYDHIIRHYQPDAIKKDTNQFDHKAPDLQQIYERKIAYFARISRNPTSAIESLTLDMKNKQLPIEIKENIKSWIHYFSEWKKEGTKDPAKFDDSKLVNYAREIVEKYTGGRKITVADPYIVNLLRVSGLLYERIFKKKPSDQVPEMLYLLGKCEKDLGSIRIYSLAEVYWRECISRYPKSPIAKKCFSAYEMELKQHYSGSELNQVNDNLDALKKLMSAE